MALVGADVNQLRDLAKLLVQGANQLDGSARAVSGQLASTRWTGPDGERYRSQWQGEAVPNIRAVITGLRDAAERVQRNAAEQADASALNAGHDGTAAARVSAGAQSSSSSGNFVVDTLGSLLSLGGIVNDVANSGEKISGVGPKGVTGVAGGVLGAAGLVTSLTTMVDGILSGDNLKTQDGIIGLSGAAAGRVHPAVGIAIGAAQLYGSITLPTSEADIDGVFDVGAKYMFGKDADQLSLEQKVTLGRRYEGAWGVANMISDSMDSKAAEAGKFFSGLFGR